MVILAYCDAERAGAYPLKERRSVKTRRVMSHNIQHDFFPRDTCREFYPRHVANVLDMI